MQNIENMIKKEISKNMVYKTNNMQTEKTQKKQKKWITFICHSPLIRKVTNLFRNTEINIAFKTANTIYQQLIDKTYNSPSGIYEIKCNTCNKKYVGQSGRNITTRYKEHIRYIRTNSNTLAYATQILNIRHEYGGVEDTLKLIHPCRKGQRMNSRETYAYKYTNNKVN